MKDEKGEREEKVKKGEEWAKRKRTREGGSGWAEKQYISASAVSEAGSC